MMKKTIIAALFLLLPSTAQAAPDKFAFDPLHTQVMFSVDHLGFSKSHGKFEKFAGGFTFDEKAPEKSSVDVSIDAASIVMGSVEWDNHIRNADFLNIEKFPVMTFKSTKIEKTGDNTGKITGDFTLLGVTAPVTLDVTFNKAGIHPYSKKYVAGFSATGVIKRSDFGMTYGLPGIGDDVAVNIQVEGIREEPSAKKD